MSSHTVTTMVCSHCGQAYATTKICSVCGQAYNPKVASEARFHGNDPHAPAGKIVFRPAAAAAGDRARG